MGNHSEGVTRVFKQVENTLDDGFWDDVYREMSYFEEQDTPVDTPARGEKGQEVGEFDVLAVNYDEQVALYFEVKTSRGDLFYAESQISRAEEFFEETEWDVYGTTYLEE